MKCKTIEVRDRATFMPCLAIQLTPACEADRYLLARAGFGPDYRSQGDYVIFLELNRAPYDPYGHRSHTMRTAHEYVVRNFETLPHGAVVDVEFIDGKTDAPKPSERTLAVRL